MTLMLAFCDAVSSEKGGYRLHWWLQPARKRWGGRTLQLRLVAPSLELNRWVHKSLFGLPFHRVCWYDWRIFNQKYGYSIYYFSSCQAPIKTYIDFLLSIYPHKGSTNRIAEKPDPCPGQKELGCRLEKTPSKRKMLRRRSFFAPGFFVCWIFMNCLTN